MSRRTARQVVPLLLAVMAAAASQPAHAAPRTVEVAFLDGDGAPVETVAAYELQLSVSAGANSPDGESRNQVSLTLDGDAVRNAALLGWVGRCDGKTGLLVRGTAGKTEDTLLLREVSSCTLSFSVSPSFNGGQFSLALTARHLVVNGTTLN